MSTLAPSLYRLRPRVKTGRPPAPKTTPSVWDILRWNLEREPDPRAEYERVVGRWFVRVG